MLAKGIAVTLSLAYGAAGVAFNGPTATPIAQTLDANGFTPKPTNVARPALDLFRRQEDDPGFCGYLEGDPDQPVSCSIGNCMYDEAYSWFGCCTGANVEDCYVQTACVEFASLSACLEEPSCYNDIYLTVCFERDTPYCAYLYTQTDGQSYGHFECATAETTFEVFSTSSDDDFSSSSPTSSDDDLSFTLEPTSTRSARSTRTSTADDSTSTAEESSTSSDGSSIIVDSTTAASTGTSTLDPFNQGPTATTGAAVKTAEVALAAGLAGVLAVLV